MKNEKSRTSTSNHFDDTAMDLCLEVSRELIPKFFKLLGQGFRLNVKTGCSIKELICGQLGIPEDYLAKRIQTIFLNGKPVDDENEAYINYDDTLALSSAMPGLVGATFRKGVILAPMRSQISYNTNVSPEKRNDSRIVLKFFNLVAKELGPTFLQRGIGIKGEYLQDFLSRYLGELETGCTSSELDGNPIELDKLLEIDWDNKLVRLQVMNECAA